MSESSPEAGRVDESAFGEGGESSIDADIATSGADDSGPTSDARDSADEQVADSHASDVAAGYDDPDDAPVEPGSGADGTL